MEQANDNDTDLLPVPLDSETRRRLARFCRETGKPAALVAAEMLAAVLEDDEQAHRPFN
jgi:predicted DNA-binding protein